MGSSVMNTTVRPKYQTPPSMKNAVVLKRVVCKLGFYCQPYNLGCHNPLQSYSYDKHLTVDKVHFSYQGVCHITTVYQMVTEEQAAGGQYRAQIKLLNVTVQ